MDTYRWNGYEYENGQTWASPLEEVAAVTDLFQEALEAKLTEQGHTVKTVMFADDQSEGYPVRALILYTDHSRAEMQRQYNEILDALRRALSN